MPWAFLSALLGGVALWAAFPPVGWWWTAPVGITFLVLAALRGGAGRAFLGGWLCGVVFFGLQWDFVQEASGLLWARVLLAGFEALAVGLFAWLLRGLSRRWRSPWTVAAGGAALWAALELLRSEQPLGGFPWGTLAFSQVGGPLGRLAPYGSTMLVSAAVAFVGILVAAGVRRRGLTRWWSVAGAALLTIGIGFLPTAAATGQTLKVGFAQGIVPRGGQGAGGLSQAIAVTDGLRAASERIQGADLLLWPESASDMDPRQDANARALIDAASQKAGVPILLGTQEYQARTRYNQYVVWMPGQGMTGLYAKQHPVPYGEYVPGREFAAKITGAVNMISVDMLAGNKPAYLDVPLKSGTVQVATPICFEVAYDGIVGEAVRAGAQFIVVPTNNASFGSTAESAQQMQMTQFRAMESGRFAVQVSTVGVSGVAAPNGMVTNETKPWTEAAEVARIRLSTTLTFATRFGEALRWITYGLGAGVAAIGLSGLISRHTAGHQIGRGGRRHRA